MLNRSTGGRLSIQSPAGSAEHRGQPTHSALQSLRRRPASEFSVDSEMARWSVCILVALQLLLVLGQESTPAATEAAGSEAASPETATRASPPPADAADPPLVHGNGTAAPGNVTAAPNATKGAAGGRFGSLALVAALAFCAL